MQKTQTKTAVIIRILLAFFLLAIFSTPSYAGDHTRTTRTLLAQCKGGSESDLISQYIEISCLGYVSGFLDTVTTMLMHWPESSRFCPPNKGASPDALLQIVSEYVKRNPDTLDQTARMTMLIAYAKAFPCD